MWTHVNRGYRGVKTCFSCGRYKWMTPNDQAAAIEGTKQLSVIDLLRVPTQEPSPWRRREPVTFELHGKRSNQPCNQPTSYRVLIYFA